LRECGFDHSILGEALLTPRLSQPSSEVLSLKRAASPRQRFLAGLGIALAIGNPRPSQRNRCVAERSSLAQILLGLENGLGGRLMALQRTTALPCGSPLARLGVDHSIELGLKAVDLSRARTGLAWASASGSKDGQHNKESGADGRTSTGSLRSPPS
jgi:hypothetical protein